MAHQPTAEQAAAIDAFNTGDTLTLVAGAGAGKTSTLKMLSAARPARPGVYVAYNKSIADEAKRSFPPNTKCSTAHGLAFGVTGRQFARRLNGPRLSAWQTAKILKINHPIGIGDTMAVLAQQQQARIVLRAVIERFCRSSDREIQPWHLTTAMPDALTDTDRKFLAEELMPAARRAWDDLSSPSGRLRFDHAVYLKLYQLMGPRIPADFILYDEAQDANPVMASILEQQTHAQLVVVGDPNQAIYGWNGAVDAMSKFGGVRLPLSKSFRFGPAIAAEANEWLDFLDAELRITGHDPVNSRLEALHSPAAILARTNAGCIRAVMAAREAGRSAALVGGADHIVRLAEAAISLKAGVKTEHPELFMFDSWAAVQDYAEHDVGGTDLLAFINLIDEYGPETVIEVCHSLAPENRAAVTVSTAHKSKGREWDTVKVYDDFRQPTDEDGDPCPPPPEAAMLAYVTVTRAKHVLDAAPLAWIHDRPWTKPDRTLKPAEPVS